MSLRVGARNDKIPPCHPERSEGSSFPAHEILRFTQDDTLADALLRMALRRRTCADIPMSILLQTKLFIDIIYIYNGKCGAQRLTLSNDRDGEGKA